MTSDEKMTVSYSAKELFAQVNTKLDVVLDRLDAKADHAELVKVIGRVDTLEDKSREAEAVASALLASKNHRFTTREKILGLAFAVLTVALNVASLFPDIF